MLELDLQFILCGIDAVLPKAESRSTIKPKRSQQRAHLQHLHLQCRRLTFASAAELQYELALATDQMHLSTLREASASLPDLLLRQNQC